ncbi:hypothetical protein [Ramlibacter alkalitolerans]|uniref:Uncharacterized protein n=1 Tax=Ramlibacter alkalitolerans TaxID=2039631 RepID=A0ABS1JW35_9BURK|nr:hypothetical protein [Ramlibacter alkalitolerans]MBL0427755.1 hypothetical protein [Ramlibacter alkalitolerans]
MSTPLTLFNPSPLVGGKALKGQRPVFEPAYNAAAHALDDSEIRFVFVEHEGAIWYLAGRNKDFNVPGVLATSLVCALPGAKNHRGPGAYVAHTSDESAVVLTTASGIQTHAGSRDDVSRFIAERAAGLGVFDVSADVALAEPWKTDAGMARDFIRKLASRLLTLAVGAFAVLAVGVVAVNAAKAYLTPVSTLHTEQIEAEFRRAASELERLKLQPIYKQLNDMQSLATLAVSQKGRLVYYRVERTGHATWALELPAYVPAKVYERLDSNVRVEQLPGGATISVTNAAPAGEPKAAQ